MSLRQAFREYIRNIDLVEYDIRASTTASHAGGCYVLELFEDGRHRTIWSGHLGNLYRSPGIMVNIPVLTEEELAEDQAENFYDNAIEELRCKVDEALKEIGQ